MTVHLVNEYLPAVPALVVGALSGALIAAKLNGTPDWDARITLPLLLAAGSAHIALIPAVEPQRQLLFGLYFLSMAGTFVFARLRFGIWRLGAVVFPLGSIGAYFYFGATVHQVDFVGLAIKAVEAAVIVSAIAGGLALPRRHVAA